MHTLMHKLHARLGKIDVKLFWLLYILLLLLVVSNAMAATTTVTWEMPTEDTAGKPLGPIKAIVVYVQLQTLMPDGQVSDLSEPATKLYCVAPYALTEGDCIIPEYTCGGGCHSDASR